MRPGHFEDLVGSIFTLTNTGSRGALFDTPIINQSHLVILFIITLVKCFVLVYYSSIVYEIAVLFFLYLELI